MPTRRQVSIQLAAAGAALLSPTQALSTGEGEGYEIGEWTGDSFAPMHAIRDGVWDRPLPSPERQVEVVIIGAGIAGLAIATLLGDFDLLLLERETEPGGNAKAKSWRGVSHALGSAYFVDVSEPFGSFYDGLGLRLPRVPEPVDRALMDAPGSPDALIGSLKVPYERLRRHIAAVADNPDFPSLPIEKATASALAFDRITLLEYLKREQVDPALFAFIDAFSCSSLGAGADQVSAYAGLNFLSDLTRPVYGFPGGNAFIVRAMAERVESAGAGRLMTGAAVFGIEPAENGLTRVGWFDALRSREPRCITARWVVLAAPLFFSARILRGAGSELSSACAGLSQGSYLVASLCFDGAFPIRAYDSWTPGNPAFTDIIDTAAAPSVGSGSMTKRVLTVYAPFRDPAQGRALLLSGDRAALAKPIVAGMKRFLPEAFADARLSEVRLTRWGHQPLIPRPGIISRLRKLPKRYGNVLLAHSDGQAMPAVESAIIEALRVAAIIRRDRR